MNPYDEETIIAAAKAAHNVNWQFCVALGDNTQGPWEKADDWQKESAINGVRNVIDNPHTTPEGSHQNWLKVKEEDGWVYGPDKDVEKKIHPCMCPYSDLPAQQKAKDVLYLVVVKSMLGMPVPFLS